MGERMENTATPLRVLGQMARLPLEIFARSMELFMRTLEGFQVMLNSAMTSTPGGSSPDHPAAPGQVPGDIAASDWGQPGQPTEIGPNAFPSSSPRETDTMDDQDLSGDDLKYVSYSILFTKPDYEATLEKVDYELLNYSTNGGSFGGLRIAKFFEKLSDPQRGVQRPQVWVDHNYPPPSKVTDDKHWTLPGDDEKYITFIYRVESRMPRQEADYDKRTVDALNRISGKIG
jgi:hypothetical protein